MDDRVVPLRQVGEPSWGNLGRFFGHHEPFPVAPADLVERGKAPNLPQPNQQVASDSTARQRCANAPSIWGKGVALVKGGLHLVVEAKKLTA